MTAAIDLIFLFVGLALGVSVMLFRQRGERGALEALLERAKNDLGDTTTKRTTERVGEIVAPIAEKLGEFDRLVREIESKRHEDTGNLKAQIENLLKRADKIETAAQALSTQTSTLVTALKNPTTRGRWGEIQLRNVVEKAGMIDYCDFAEQQTIDVGEGRARPDMTIKLPGNRKVFVDAKAPTDALQAAFEAIDDDARRELVKRHAKALQDHIDALSKRAYHTVEGSADFVIMFVPGEAFLSAACNENPMLIEYALDRGVLVAGPLSLMGLLRSFAMGWQAVKQEENAKRIAAIGRELYERTTKFAEKLAKVGQNLERSVAAYNESIGSYESRLLPQGRKLKDEAGLTGDLQEIDVIDVVPRPITALDADTGGRKKRDPATPNLFQNHEDVG
ncbi:MAG TPA: DNA recombination protein RmuC [Candidatus Baltobacteraceae bacterium]|nr:DNA recombination protein RmuC [Candidatus Baltobacteraceae bacterium]